MSVIPEMLRGAVRPKLLDFIAGKAGPGGSVTENMVVEAVKEMKPPEPFMSQIMNLLAAGSGVDVSKADAILSRYKGSRKPCSPSSTRCSGNSATFQGGARKVSEQLSIPLSAVYRVATSYPAFSLEPKKQHVVKVCDGFACHLKDSAGCMMSSAKKPAARSPWKRCAASGAADMNHGQRGRRMRRRQLGTGKDQTIVVFHKNGESP